jgi:hypothetical protein
MSEPSFEVRPSKDAVTCVSMLGMDTDRLPFVVWDVRPGTPAFGEFVCACPDRLSAHAIAAALSVHSHPVSVRRS